MAVRGILNDPDLQRRRQILSPPPASARPGRVAFADPDPENAQAPVPIRREYLRPPPAERPEGDRQRIGFGGAVLRQGARQINYDRTRPQANAAGAGNVNGPARGAADYLPARRAQAQHLDRANLDEEINERIQRRIRDRDDAGYAGVVDMLGGVMGNWGLVQEMEGMFRGAAGRAGLMERVRMMRAEHFWPGAGAGAGPAGMANQRRLDDPQTIIAQVPQFDYPPLPDGYTFNFEIDSTIEIDQPASSKRYLACVYCADPLLLDAGQKSPGDRVWALRCGHLIDQKCLEKLSSPQSEADSVNINRPPPGGLPVLGEEEAPTGRGGRRAKKPRPNTRKTANKPVEYEWTCPAKECGHIHKSVLKDAEWIQLELEGALQMYA